MEKHQTNFKAGMHPAIIGDFIDGIGMEDLQYIFADQTVLLMAPRVLRRHDGGGGDRYYYTINPAGELEFFISTTTFCRKVLQMGDWYLEWLKKHGDNADAIRDLAADYGTLMHIVFPEYLLQGFDFSATRDRVDKYIQAAGHPRRLVSKWTHKLNKNVAAFAAFCEEYEVEPVLLEGMLASGELGIGGTVDLICYMKVKNERILASIDFKSGGIYESAELQLAINKHIFEENFPHLRIEKSFNWAPKDWIKEPTYTLKDQTKSRYNSYRAISTKLENYKLDFPSEIEDKKVLSFKGKVGPGMSKIADAYKIQTLWESVEEALLFGA